MVRKAGSGHRERRRADLQRRERRQAGDELEAVKTDTPAGDFPLEGDRANVEEVGEESGEVEDIAAGKSKPLQVSLEPGKYVLICNLPGHYKSGMHSAFTVQ